MSRCTVSNFYWLLATGYWLLATGYWLLATGYWLLTTRYEGVYPSNCFAIVTNCMLDVPS
jgi:uncharacterized membrane protein YccF (DUF307 family)